MADHMRLSLDIMSVDRQSDEPMHRQIYGTLRRYILDGQIQAQTLLPSTRSLAEDLKVGRNTVIAAYHTGVERKWWRSFIEGCSTPDLSGNIDDLLARIEKAPVTACDSMAWADPVLGLSMANYNVMFCLVLGVIALMAIMRPEPSAGR